MKTTNILLGAGFLVGGYVLIKYFSKQKTLNSELNIGNYVYEDIEEPETRRTDGEIFQLYTDGKKRDYQGSVVTRGTTTTIDEIDPILRNITTGRVVTPYNSRIN
jgi:hypothetical protein